MTLKRVLPASLFGLYLFGCGGSTPQSYTIGGNVSGLEGSLALTEINSQQTLNIEQNGSFSYPGMFAANTAYNFVISNQPPTQDCLIDNASGVLNTDVSNIAINCQHSNLLGKGNWGQLIYQSKN